jgi:hypothetical protein
MVVKGHSSLSQRDLQNSIDITNDIKTMQSICKALQSSAKSQSS